MNKATLERPKMALALLVLLVVASGVYLYMAKKSKPSVGMQYDTRVAYDLLRKSGKLIEPQDGVLPFRLGISKAQFERIWTELDNFKFDQLNEMKVLQINQDMFDSPVFSDISQKAIIQIVLMKMIVHDLVDGVGGGSTIYDMEGENGRIDRILVRSDSREYYVSKYILDAFDGDETAISGDTIQGVIRFMRKNFRQI